MTSGRSGAFSGTDRCCQEHRLLRSGYDPVYGARPLKRYLQKYVETLAAKKILSGDVHAGDILVLDVKDGEFVINTK